MHSFTATPISNVEIIDDLLDIDRSVYETVIASFLEEISRETGVLYVGKMGHIGTPGVSDIDLMIICEDDCYPAVRRRARTVIQTIPHAQYCFAHQVLILPRSLAPDRCTLFFHHIIDAQRTLYGDGALLDEAPTPSREQSALTRMIWNTTLWRILNTPVLKKGLRSLMLLIQMLNNHSAIDTVIMGGSAAPIIKEGKTLRVEILSSFSERTERARIALEKELNRFTYLERALQCWWKKEALRENTHLDGYACVTGALRELFHPHLLAFPKFDVSLLQDAWKEAFTEYCDAVDRAKNVSTSLGKPAFDLFLHHGEGIFPSPYNLADAKIHRFPFRSATHYKPLQTLIKSNISFADHALEKQYYGQMAELFETLCPRSAFTEQEVEFIVSQAKKHKKSTNSFLDVACGTGRHTRLLAQQGYRTAGVDASSALLERARTLDPQSAYIEGDMRTFTCDGTFDCILCMWDAYPYLSRTQDISAFLERCYLHLAPEGVLILHSRNFGKTIEQEIERKKYETEDYTIDLMCRRKTLFDAGVHEGIFTTCIQDKKTGESAVIVDQELVSTYDTETVTSFLEKQGFTLCSVYGDFDGTSFDADHSLHQIIVAKRL